MELLLLQGLTTGSTTPADKMVPLKLLQNWPAGEYKFTWSGNSSNVVSGKGWNPGAAR